MKKNKLLVLSLMACTILTGCSDDDTFVQNGSSPVGTVEATNKKGEAVSLDTVMTLQDLYTTLKTSSGGSVALNALIEKISYLEYFNGGTLDGGFAPQFDSSSFSVKQYHDADTFKDDISEHFKDIIEGHSYDDDDGNFDANEYLAYVEDSLDYEIDEDAAYSTKWLNEDVAKELKYNYDEYIEETIIPDILEDYIYLDYLTASSKYKGQFSNQYAIELEVLKIPYDSTALNGAWNEAFVKDVKAVTGTTDLTTYSFGANAPEDYSFVTFDSDRNLIVFEATSTALNYTVYKNDDAVDTLYDTMFKSVSKAPIKQLKFTDASVKTVIASATKDTDKSFVIDSNSTADQTFYEQVEDVLIARDLWKIDHEVVLAANYDYDTTWYESMTETEKSSAESYSSTYSSSNAKPLKDVVKSKKITAQQTEYYTAPDYYTKSTYTNVLPTALSSLRGTSAKELQTHLHTMKDGTGDFLLPSKDTYTDPVYFDEDGSNYYICEVGSYYGLYLSQTASYTTQTVTPKSVTNYQIDCYQKGVLTMYAVDGTSYKEDSSANISYSSETKEGWKDTIELVKVTADQILTTAMKKEAIVALFTTYGLEINDQDVYDYIKEQYPDYFSDDDD